MRILLDGDMLLFWATTATEVEVHLGDDIWTRHSELPAAREKYWGQVNSWCDLFGVSQEDVWHCFTDASAFRRELYPDYKYNRKGKPKPIGFKQLRNELLTEETAFMFHRIEADDAIGIFATMPEVKDDPVIIASGDKDLMQIPGTHVWIHNGREPEAEQGVSIGYIGEDSIVKTNTSEHSERFTYVQYLTGDSTDGVPGCPGIGAVSAKRIVEAFDLSKPVDCWEEIVRTYEKKGKMVEPSDFATQQARLVRILRHGEYDFSSHTVELWNPPTR
jgi:DNA polymerase-1